jgi:O-antigen/teichoic acid export membrane protein
MHKLLIKDAFWQILWRIISAIWGFLVVKIMTPYLWPLRFGDYSTILKFFAIWSAFADFGLYVIALRRLWELKDSLATQSDMEKYYGKFVMSRFTTITIVYTVALLVAYLIPAYTSNPYLLWGLPLGMIFSASFMTAGILQLPLQLYRWMKHVSIALTLARIAQVIVMIVLVSLYQWVDFSSWDKRSVTAFVLMIGTVVVSAFVQGIYVLYTSNRHIKLRLVPDWQFTWWILKENRQYWLAYCLSSLHTLWVMILIGIYYPTVDKFDFVGIWAVSSALMEILLIVPSSLWNSIIPKVTAYTLEQTRKVFGNLLLFILWIGWIFFINFTVFRESIIAFVSGDAYLSATTGTRGSDSLLPRLALVLLLSFTKQVYNFLFVSLHLNNKLLKVNAVWVSIWAVVWFILIPLYGIWWWIITQLIMELIYVAGWLFIAYKQKASLTFSWRYALGICLCIVLFTSAGRYFLWDTIRPILQLLPYVLALNALMLLVSYKPVKVIMRGFNQ